MDSKVCDRLEPQDDTRLFPSEEDINKVPTGMG